MSDTVRVTTTEHRAGIRRLPRDQCVNGYWSHEHDGVYMARVAVEGNGDEVKHLVTTIYDVYKQWHDEAIIGQWDEMNEWMEPQFSFGEVRAMEDSMAQTGEISSDQVKRLIKQAMNAIMVSGMGRIGGIKIENLEGA